MAIYIFCKLILIKGHFCLLLMSLHVAGISNICYSLQTHHNKYTIEWNSRNHYSTKIPRIQNLLNRLTAPLSCKLLIPEKRDAELKKLENEKYLLKILDQDEFENLEELVRMKYSGLVSIPHIITLMMSICIVFTVFIIEPFLSIAFPLPSP